MIRYIELFAGIGGFRYGMESTNGSKNGRSQKDTQTDKGQRFQSKKGKDTSTTQGQNNEQSNSKPKQRTFNCVYSNEWDKYAAQIYTKHYGECDTRDITTVPSSEIPDFDLLVGGFPCQAFSIAGKRKGFDDTRGTLFFEIARILADKRPRYFILENVKGLLSHDGGKTFQTILGVFTDLGYEFEWQVLNSKNFGVPQNRERVFIIGHIRGTSRPKVFPITEANSKVTRRIQGDISGKGYASEQDRVYFPDSLMACLPAMRTESKVNVLVEEMKIRRLTPTECERLQGFPDGWTEGISDTQRYKCLGNAVTTNVITAIIERMFL